MPRRSPTTSSGTPPIEVSRQRLAVALLLAGPLAFEVDGLRRACGDGMLGRVAPHITLVPPVNVREDDFDATLTTLRAAAAARRSPITVTVGPARSFAPDSPVLYLQVTGDVDGVVALRSAVRRGPLDRPDQWPFVPHVTIGTDLTDDRLSAGVAALAGYGVQVTFTRVHLLREERDAGGVRRWRPIADAAFGPPAVVGRGGLPLELTASTIPDPEAARLTGRSLVVTARRDGAVVGVAIGRVRGDDVIVDELALADGEAELGTGDHLLERLRSERDDQE